MRILMSTIAKVVWRPRGVNGRLDHVPRRAAEDFKYNFPGKDDRVPGWIAPRLTETRVALFAPAD